MGKIIGIDLGTTNSVASFTEGGHPTVISTQEGERLLPSMVAFNASGEPVVGSPAKSQLLTNTNTLYSIKRLIGKRFSEVQPYLHQFHYMIKEGADDTVRIQINDMSFSPEEVSAMILEKLKNAAEIYTNDTVDGAIITVPAYFNDSQRQATKDAGEIAGLKVLRIINEPTAASLAFSLDLSRKSRVVVYDLGGGTFDLSILEIDGEVIKVLATAGDINLGGNDLDLLLMEKILSDIQKEFNISLLNDKMALQRIKDAAESAKKELSGIDACEITLPFLADTEDGPLHFSGFIKRSEFERLIEKKIDKTLSICTLALNNARISIHEIDEVLLVGGSTRIPLVQQKVKVFFQKEPNKKVNPDEIVAMGAAIQAAILKGEREDVLLLDVIPISLGVQTLGGAFIRIIEANTTIPTNRSLVFTTAEDNQEEVEIRIFQGEEEKAEDNKGLGRFTLKGIRPAPKGYPRIEVKFSIDIDGILKVTAIDLSTQIKNEVIITNSGLLTEHEKSGLKKKTENFRKINSARIRLVELKNKIYNYVFSIQKMLNETAVDTPLKNDGQNLIKIAKEEVEKENSSTMENIFQGLIKLEQRLKMALSGSHSTVSENSRVHTAQTSSSSSSSKSPQGQPSSPIVIPKSKGHETKSSKESNAKDALHAKELLSLKQDILNNVYYIEQYMTNIQLESSIEQKATELIQKAYEEIEKNDLGSIKKISQKMSTLIARLDELVGFTMGLTDSDQASGNKEEKEDNPSSISTPKNDVTINDDTKPYKIFEG